MLTEMYPSSPGRVALARERRRRFDLCESLIVQGRLYVRRNRLQEAESVLTEARSLARNMPHPYAEARALVQSALSAAAVGDQDQARTRLEHACGILRRLGARPDLERAQRIVMQVGEV